eukprot:256512-Pelagomonas_calceolata.AAC.1
MQHIAMCTHHGLGFADNLSKAVSSSAKGRGASKRASKHACTSKGMRTRGRVCEESEEEEGSEESEEGNASTAEDSSESEEGGGSSEEDGSESEGGDLAAVMRRARRGVAALRVGLRELGVGFQDRTPFGLGWTPTKDHIPE